MSDLLPDNITKLQAENELPTFALSKQIHHEKATRLFLEVTVLSMYITDCQDNEILEPQVEQKSLKNQKNTKNKKRNFIKREGEM